jgi:hypothetical protein
MGKEEQNTQKIVYPYQFKIDLDLLEKRAVFRSTINECLQEIQMSYKKLTSRVHKEQTLNFNHNVFFCVSLNIFQKNSPKIVILLMKNNFVN